MTSIATIGYEGRGQHEVLRLLAEAGVTRLVDVRIRSQSRKPGFSKSTLTSGLAEIDIQYEHLRALGTPADIKTMFKAKETARAREAYRAFLREDEDAARALELLAAMAAESGTLVAILCFEHEPRECHRWVIAEQLAEQHGIDAVHLGAPTVA